MATEATLLGSLNPTMQFSTETGPIALNALAESRPWAAITLSSLKLAAESNRKNDKALSGLISGLAKYAMERQGILLDSNPGMENVFKRVYTEVNQAAKKATEADTLHVSADFAQAVYTEILPVILGINIVSDKWNNDNGYNSVDQVVSTAMTFMHAQQIRDAGGTFTIFQQMCAHYDSGSSHDASSFARGLLEQLDESKITKALDPVNKIVEVLKRFHVPVEIVQAQVVPHGELLLAMVPATVWSYLEEEGGAAHMLHILNAQNHHFKHLAQKTLHHATEDEHRLIGYNEIVSAENTSLTEETTQLCERFGELFTAFQHSERFRGEEKSWTMLDPSDVQSLLRFLDYDFHTGSFFDKTANEFGWSREVRQMMEIVIRTLGIEDWGTLADTAKFYGREHQRRAASTAESWKRTMDLNAETQALLKSTSFHPELSELERIKKAQELLSWVDIIANIGIGARAVYNTALYATLGMHITRLNHGSNKAVMWPLEEDADRWGLHVMDSVWKTFSQQHTPRIPHIMPKKSHRQPFSKTA